MENMTAESNHQMSTFDKIVNVFVSPRMTFQSINRKPDWVIPMIIVVAVAVMFTTFIMPIVLPEQMEQQREGFEERGMSEEEIARAMEMGQKVGRIVGPISAGVMTIVYLLAVAGVLLFCGNIILGGETNYKRVLSVVSYSSLIGSLGTILLLPLVLAKKTMHVNYSLAVLMSSEAHDTPLYQSLSKIDFFAIWQVIVVGIGLSVIYKFTTKKSITLVAILYALYAIISVIITMLF
ncbi:hypothetical protein GF337_14630 [candidate division KSB1 bacterium]|nr:hypothetical protein [candidate division KSB1 bacterium]